MNRGDGWRSYALAGIALVLAPLPVRAAVKTDVVVLRNGNTLTGEVDEVDRGRLTFKTDDMGTLEIEWDKVTSVTASATFEVNDLSGGQYVGVLQPGLCPGEVNVVTATGPRTLELPQVVEVYRLGATLWQRLDGSINVGTSYTSSNSLFELDVTSRVVWTQAGHKVSFDGNSTLTTQPNAQETRRNQLALGYERRFPNRWVAYAQGQLEQNRELGFDLRGAVLAGGGRYLVQDRHQALLTGLGLSVNREKPVDGETTTNEEAALGLRYDRFAYDFPKVDVSLSLTGFQGLNDWGRQRLELDLRLQREIVRDFTVSFRVYESYDSRPATEGAPHNDYGLSFGLGWTF
jgi:hypothetical protein